MGRGAGVLWVRGAKKNAAARMGPMGALGAEQLCGEQCTDGLGWVRNPSSTASRAAGRTRSQVFLTHARRMHNYVCWI